MLTMALNAFWWVAETYGTEHKENSIFFCILFLKASLYLYVAICLFVVTDGQKVVVGGRVTGGLTIAHHFI